MLRKCAGRHARTSGYDQRIGGISAALVKSAQLRHCRADRCIADHRVASLIRQLEIPVDPRTLATQRLSSTANGKNAVACPYCPVSCRTRRVSSFPRRPSCSTKRRNSLGNRAGEIFDAAGNAAYVDSLFATLRPRRGGPRWRRRRDHLPGHARPHAGRRCCRGRQLRPIRYRWWRKPAKLRVGAGGAVSREPGVVAKPRRWARATQQRRVIMDVRCLRVVTSAARVS